MRIKKYMFFIVILIGSLIGSANMKEVKAEDSESIEDIVELSLLYSGSDVTWVAAIETLCDEFMAQNPNIIINTENIRKFVQCLLYLKFIFTICFS